MKKLVLLFAVVFGLTGCQSLTQGIIDDAESHLRLKWAEEWKPGLQAELLEAVADSKGVVLEQVFKEVEHNEKAAIARLEAVNVKIENFDSDGDGLVTGTESLVMLKELKAAKDKDGNPLGWYEILMAVVLGYGGTTAGKEFLKSKMTGTGNGSSVA